MVDNKQTDDVTELFKELFLSQRNGAIDVTEWASKRGFKCPVSITGTLWAMICCVPSEYRGHPSVHSRTADILFLASLAMREASSRGLQGNYFSVFLPTSLQRDQETRLEVVRKSQGILIGYPGEV